MSLPATNPYGETKAMSERILTDVAKANLILNNFLRYLIGGAHESGLIVKRLLAFLTSYALCYPGGEGKLESGFLEMIIQRLMAPG